MKTIITLVSVVIAFSLKAQVGPGYISVRNNPFTTTSDRYVQVTGVSTANSRVIERIDDSTYIRFMSLNLVVDCLNDTSNKGTPANIVWSLGSGSIQISPVSELTLGINQSIGLQDSLNVKVSNIVSGNNNILITGTSPNVTITPYTPITYSVTRAINGSTFQPSSNRNCSVLYNVAITCTATIAGSSNGKVLLQYSIDSGSTWLDVSEIENFNSVSSAPSLQSVTKHTSSISMINAPIGSIFRLVPEVNGDAEILYIRGFETY